ncbi:MAG: phospho-sugar mutase [Deltaproteobacteria bacterium]|nr:phospho-sugar mutase [Deltaproteobacteria bacterium]
MTDELSRIKTAFVTLSVEEDIRKKAIDNIITWWSEKKYEPYRPYIGHLVKMENWETLLDSFWRMMPFGTGGRRGPVGAGPNRINPYTVGLSVQGHCDYLKSQSHPNDALTVVVAHDVRQFFDLRGLYQGVKGVLFELTSLDMARISATIYAANSIKAIVIGPLQDGPHQKKCTDKYISTPELSFLIREYGAAGGLNISASHNHPDDNGGKFYNRYGGQEIPPDDEKLLQVVENVRYIKTMAYEDALAAGQIEFVSPKVHGKYISLNTSLIHTTSRSAKIGYTPLCGTGMTTVHEALHKIGFEVVTVTDQAAYDGSFKSVRYRIGNPEVPDSMDRLEQTATETGCDVGFSSDPDADRLGMIAKRRSGQWEFINGHLIGVLLVQSIISDRKKQGTLTESGIFVNTLVTTSLQRTIAAANGLQVVGDLMVGCKYIGDVVRCLEEHGAFPFPPKPDKDSVTGTPSDYIFGNEESHGYLVSPDVRDKDACGAAVQLSGLICDLKDGDKTVEEYLRDIYRVYGYYRNSQRSLVMDGIEGLYRIRHIQEVLRENPPKTIAGMTVIRFVDYQKVGGPVLSSTDAASRNVLLFELDGGDGMVIRLVIRPSGTEPKTKIYVEVPSLQKVGGTLDDTSPEELSTISDEMLDTIIATTDARAFEIGNTFIRYCLGKDVLGDVFPQIPNESLLVSDLVTVDNKIFLCTHILPNLVDRIRSGSESERWLEAQLRPFGEDAIGLVGHAAKAWINRLENDISESDKQKALSMFR